MANEKNLIPFNERTESEQRKIQSKGGKKSGEVRREKKAFRELADTILSAENKNEELINIARLFGIENPDNKTLVVLGLTRAAIYGNHNAFDRLHELTGEKSQSYDTATVNENINSLADLINKPMPNRNIEDFEDNE